MNQTYAYFHAAPTGEISRLYLSLSNRTGRAVAGKPLASMMGTQTATGPNWDRVGETEYSHFGGHNGN